MHDKDALPQDMAGALAYIVDCWPVVDAHIEEVFFNDKGGPLPRFLMPRRNQFFKVTNFAEFAGRQVIEGRAALRYGGRRL
ncbi:MAG: hypothetical protein ACLU7D_05915 [Collinsella sp.]